MRVLVTGQYEQDYNRVAILLTGLKRHGVELIEFPYEKRNRSTRKKLVEAANSCDIVFLPSFTHLDVPFVKKNVSKPVVFDPLISRYLTKVFDRKTVWKYSPRAYKNYLKDKRAFRYSDLILADTQAHKNYYCQQFNIDPEKIDVIPVGVNTKDFFPQATAVRTDETIITGFYGSFIPLHGIDRILLAARELRSRKNIRFIIYGTGELFNKILLMKNKLELDNIELKGWISYNELNTVINNMDICLGIFGISLKTELVIPNKVYHYAACRKPIITRDTKGIREIFTPDENIILSSNDPADLAEKIIYLADHQKLRSKIGDSAYYLIHKDYNEMKITENLINSFNKIINSYYSP